MHLTTLLLLTDYTKSKIWQIFQLLKIWFCQEGNADFSSAICLPVWNLYYKSFTIRLFHPQNSFIVNRNQWVILLSKIW
jgi:hypothetical protein